MKFNKWCVIFCTIASAVCTGFAGPPVVAQATSATDRNNQGTVVEAIAIVNAAPGAVSITIDQASLVAFQGASYYNIGGPPATMQSVTTVFTATFNPNGGVGEFILPIRTVTVSSDSISDLISSYQDMALGIAAANNTAAFSPATLTSGDVRIGEIRTTGFMPGKSPITC